MSTHVVHLHLIETMRGSERKKKEDRRARACLVFPILWTLDPLSPGFNFYPLPLTVILRPGAPSRASSCVFLLAVPPTSFVADLPTYSDTVHATMLPSPRCETRRCTMRQQSGAAPLPAGSPRVSSQLLFPFFSLFLVFLSFCFFLSLFLLSTRCSFSMERGNKNQLSPAPSSLFSTGLAVGNNDHAITRARNTRRLNASFVRDSLLLTSHFTSNLHSKKREESTYQLRIVLLARIYPQTQLRKDAAYGNQISLLGYRWKRGVFARNG